MIPVTYPSSLSYKTTRQMVAFPIADITGKRRWTDYIPVKFVNQTTFTVENTHDNNAYVAVDVLSSITNLKEGIDYIPIYIDDAATDAWQVSATGYIPVGYSGASLSLQFAGSTFLDSRITFTRASSGTYFDSAGVLRRANRNLLTYSEQFDNAAWAKFQGSITANAGTAPDGALSADLFIPDTNAGDHSVAQNLASQDLSVTRVFSVYLKASGLTTYLLSLRNAAQTIGIQATFDLNAVTAVANNYGSPTSALTPTITPVGNGWFRCTVGGALSATTEQLRCVVIRSFTGDGTSGIFIWGAQLEEGSSATVYAKTVASTSGAPRFDHDPVTKLPRGLLIEEQRTNLLTRSEEFDNAIWTAINVSVTANAAIAPDGTLTADKLIPNTTSADHLVSQGIGTVPTSTTYTLSFYAKAAEYTWCRVSFGGVAGGGFGFFNLATGVVGSVNPGDTATIQSIGNGWYRCSYTRTTTTSAGLRGDIYAQSADNQFGWAGNGTSGIFIWGAQLEAGSFATSYIPTVAAQVTRSADSASMTGTNFSSWYRADEGTLFVETQASANANTIYAGMSNGATNQNAVFFDNDSGSMRNVVFSGGVAQAVNSLSTVGTVGALNKLAAAYKVNDFAASRNAGASVTDTSGSIPLGVSQLDIGRNPNAVASTYVNGCIRKLAFYPARLANATLQSLTA